MVFATDLPDGPGVIVIKYQCIDRKSDIKRQCVDRNRSKNVNVLIELLFDFDFSSPE